MDNLQLLTSLKPVALDRGWLYRTHQSASVEQITPSHGLPDDIVDLIHNANDRIEHHQYATGPNGKSLIEGYYARLYSLVRYPYAETFSCIVPDATLVLGPLGIAVTDHAEVLPESTLYGSNTGIMLWAIKDLALLRDEVIRGPCVSLLGYGATNYAHWLLDCLPRLTLLKDDFHMMIPPGAARFHRESLALLGIPEERILVMNQPNIRVEHLIVSHAAHDPADPHPQHLLALRDRLLKALNLVPHPHRMIYISRAKAVRQIVNEAELLPILTDYGFECVCSEDLSFADQVRLFSESRVVIGAHGAGIHNHIFCDAGATVIELFNPRLWTLSACRSASIMGHQHWHTFVENVGNQLETHVDPKRLESLLRSALNMQI